MVLQKQAQFKACKKHPLDTLVLNIKTKVKLIKLQWILLLLLNIIDKIQLRLIYSLDFSLNNMVNKT